MIIQELKTSMQEKNCQHILLVKRVVTLTGLPFFLNTGLYSIEILVKLGLGRDLNANLLDPLSSFEQKLSLASQVRHLLMETYQSYPLFMMTMLALTILKMIADYLKKSSTHQTKQPHSSLINICKLAAYLTLSYCLCSLLLNMTMIKLKESPKIVTRNLESTPFSQGNEDQSSVTDANFINLNVTSVSANKDFLSSVAMGSKMIVISDDANCIFAILKEWVPTKKQAALALINIANPLLPLLPSGVIQFSFPYRHISLALSPDNQVVFFTNCGNFHQMFLSNTSDVSSTMFTDSKICDETRLKLYQPSIAISSNGQVAMISVGGLFIYNVSKLHREELLFADNATFTTSVALLSMRKIALVGGYGLTIYDVSNFSSPRVLVTLHPDYLTTSIAVSTDEKTAVIASFALNSSALIVRIIDLTEGIFPTLESLEIKHSDQDCNIDSDFPPIVKITPDNDYIFWSCGKTHGNIYFATLQIKNAFLESDPINSIVLSKNGKLFVTSNDKQTSISKIGLSVEPSRSLIWNPQHALSFRKFPNVTRILPSEDGNTVYFCYQNNEKNSSYLQILDITNSSRPIIQGYLKLEQDPLFMTLSGSQKFLYILQNSTRINIIDLSNKWKPFISQRVKSERELNNQFVVSPNDKTIYATNKIQEKEQHIMVFEVSPRRAYSFPFNIEQTYVTPFITISNSGETLFYTRSLLHKFNHFNSSLVNFTISGKTSKTFQKVPLVISSDDNFAFSLEVPNNKYLNVYNISRGWEKVQQFEVPYSATTESLNYFKQNKMIYTKTPQGYLAINVSSPKNPTFSKFLKLHPSWKVTAVTPNNLLIASQDYLEIFPLEPQYALYISSDRFQLGESSSLKLQILKANILKKYDDLESDYKFIKLNLLKENESVPKFEPHLSDLPLPNWMYFDSSQNEISLEPRSLSQVNSYHLYTVASLKLEKDTFSSFFKGDDEVQNRLIKELLERDYIDEDLFLTSKYYSAKSLLLSSRFVGSEIQDLLREFIIEQGVAISVNPSLFLRQSSNDNGFLSIETPSKQSIIVEIELKSSPSKSEQAQFLKRHYSVQKTTLNFFQTKIILEGPLLSINEALKGLFIDLKGNQTEVEAIITIDDNLNAPLPTAIKNATQFFKINQMPLQNNNHTIQAQIEKFSFVSGQSFSINLNSETFYDINDEALHYSLSGEPDWIILNGLSLIGTPPKTFFPSKINLVMIAKNEFKKGSVEFTITYTASFAIIIRQLVIYCGYLFSLYKFWLHFDKFFNILGKRFYQYPKEYQVEICQEVTDTMVAPIKFIAKEMKIIRIILNELRKHYAASEKLLISHFSDSSDMIDQQKLVQSIQDMIKTSLSYENKRRLYSYSRGTKDFQDLINQLVANEIILEKIKQPEEKLTLSVFNQIKPRWIEFVKRDCSQLGFSVNRNALEELCCSKNDESSSVPLIKSGVNFDLLEIAIKVHSYKTHNLKKKQAGIKIRSKEKKVGFSLWFKIKEFLKLNLVDLKNESQDELGYGLKYSIENNELRFGGVVAANMFDTSVVVQLVNKKGLIMREIEIYGVENLPMGDRITENQMELPL